MTTVQASTMRAWQVVGVVGEEMIPRPVIDGEESGLHRSAGDVDDGASEVGARLELVEDGREVVEATLA